MADKWHGVVVLTAGLEGAELDREQVSELMGDALLDETEGSMTGAWKLKKDANKVVKALEKGGLVADESLFRLEVEVPKWIEAFEDVAASMMEHGG